MSVPTFDPNSLCITLGDVKFHVTVADDDPVPYGSLDRLVDLLDPNADYTHYCERNYSLWEDNVAAPLLRKHGLKHGRFRSAESDSFGPLSRCVTLFFEGQRGVVLYYG